MGVAIAQEAPADENNPLNAVVKLEVSTAKPDIFCPWANRTGASGGSGVMKRNLIPADRSEDLRSK